MKKITLGATFIFAFFGIFTGVAFASTPVLGIPTYDTSLNTVSISLTDMGGASSVMVGFEYGTDTNYGRASEVSVLTAPGTFSFVPQITCGTEFHYRAFATNSGGTTSGTTLTNDFVAECVKKQTAPVEEPTPIEESAPEESAPQPEIQEPEVAAPTETVVDETVREEAPVETPQPEEVPEEVVTPEEVLEEAPVVEPAEETPTEEAPAEVSAIDEAALAFAAGIPGKPWMWVLGILVLGALGNLAYRKYSRRKNESAPTPN